MTNQMNYKNFLLAALSYLLWGFLPLYWKLMGRLDPVFILANRVLWSLVFTVAILFFSGRMSGLREYFTNRRKLAHLLPAAALVTINWGVFIWAVSNGRMLESSLGYYINPLVVAVYSITVFREPVSKLEIAAIFTALAGVIFSIVQYGRFPVVSLILAFSFASYGALKKHGALSGTESIAAETLIITPFALGFLIFSPQSAASLGGITVAEVLLCVGAGAVTATPLILYANAVRDLPFIIVGFLQYITPTFMLIIGLMDGESLSAERAVSFVFIWMGLLIFSVGCLLRRRREVALS